MPMTVVTRIAPSPTGFLHIGNARTALFNYLFAKHHGGKFLLRIEDTDRERHSQAAVDAILDGLTWLGIIWDGEPVHQFSRAPRHVEVAQQLLATGHAYHCYCTQEELKALREQNLPYDRRWRDSTLTPPAGVKPALRLKTPLTGEVVITDHVRGEVRVPAAQIEDLVILRSDGTPTYNLAVVVDDHDMNVTHIIRGEDHLTNTAKQIVLYQAMGWNIPEFAHVPLIHGQDGAKLSKRHGALGAADYRAMGYLPEALRNYLLRLGWAHGDAETISDAQAVEWFSLGGIGKSASRFDLVKLDNLNAHYIREADDARLVELVTPFIEKKINSPLATRHAPLLLRGMSGLKARAKTLKELADNAVFYVVDTVGDLLKANPKAQGILAGGGKDILAQLTPELALQADWRAEPLQAFCKAWAEQSGKKLGDVAQPLRVGLTGSTVSPGVFEVMEVLGKDESLARLKAVL